MVAAQRGGVTDVIVPQDNARDLKEIPQQAKKGLRFHLVRSMDDVTALALIDQTVGSA
jgi:ATP-dependent Lon protease